MLLIQNMSIFQICSKQIHLDFAQGEGDLMVYRYGRCVSLTWDCLKITTGASTLFFLAASLSMTSASSTLPWVISQRGDSGMNLHGNIKFHYK